MTVDRNSSRYAGDELNRVRVEISSCFEEIDVYFAARVRALWERVAQILRDHTGALLGPGRTRRRATMRCAGSSRCSPRPPSPARGCDGPSSSCSPCGWTTARSCTPGCARSWTG